MENEKDLLILGETSFRNEKWRFGIKPDDRRRHMYIVGSTGMGKSELLKSMAVQDMYAGRGFAFIDPHGDTADTLLDFIPEHRIKDVVYFDPGDLDFPISFNIMESVNYDYRHLVASGLLGVFKKIWGAEAWSGRMEYILNNTILALLEYPSSTLLGINRLMSQKSYRDKVVDKVKDPIVRSFWVDEFAKYADRFATEATAAIQNKVGQFASNNLIRNIIGQVNSRFDIRKIMDDGKILIANVSKGKIGEDASRLLGALLITKIQLAAMSRVDIPESERRDFHLYVDEFQNFATESFANILSEARKFHLSLVVAHQYIKQMEEEVRDAVFGNVGTIISFRVGAEDAEYLEKWFAPDFMMADIVNLGKFNIYLKLMIDGVSSKGFSSSTLPPFPKPERSYRNEVVAWTRQQYATPRKDVEAEVAKWSQEASEEIVAEEAARWAKKKKSGGPSHQGQNNVPRPSSQNISHVPPAPSMAPSAPATPEQKNFNQSAKGLKEALEEAMRSVAEKKEQKQDITAQQIVAKKEEVKISLGEAFKSLPVDFRGQKIESKPKNKQKEVDLGELRSALEEVLKNRE